ncbi:MAG: phosphatidate cytidylyltransferase [Nitrospinales bacterium]
MQFINPLYNELFLPTTLRIVVLLGISLALIIFVEGKKLSNLKDSVLFKRWLSWAVISPIFICSVLGGLGTITIFVTLMTLQGLREYSQLAQLPTNYKIILLIMGVTAAPVAAVSIEGFHFLAPFLLIVATLQPILFGDIKSGVRHLAFAVFGWGYIAWFLAHLILLHRNIDGGEGIILAMGIAVAFSDIGAFVIGKKFGKHKLSPRLSPNKTMEGTLGNVLGAFLGILLMGFALPSNLYVILIWVLPPLIGIGAVWGDLVESAIKREFEVKDAGTWLPGFGGILDRIDSFILVAPIAYFFLKVIV